MSHKSHQKPWVITGVKRTGDNSNLGVGQIAIVGDKVFENGLKVIDPTQLANHSMDFWLERGTQGAINNRSKTPPIKSMEFKGIVLPRMPKPGRVTIGFDGHDENKTIDFSGNKTQTLVFVLKGESLRPLGFQTGEYRFTHVLNNQESFDTSCGDSCAPVPCQPIVSKAVRDILAKPIAEGVTFGDFYEGYPIFKCPTAPTVTETDVKYHCLTKCDSGSEQDLAEVQATLKEGKAWVSAREGGETTYKVLIKKSANAPTTFTTKLGQYIKNCEDCKTGYNEIEGGYVYIVDLEDDGVNRTSVVQALPNAVAGSAMLLSREQGFGKYIVTLEEDLSNADFQTFITANPTAKVGFDSISKATCAKSTPDTFTWEECGECKISVEKYRVTLRDTECGDTRLSELQKAYPNHTVTELATPAPSGCRRTYEIEVPTNISCVDCHPNFFYSEAPVDFEGMKWVLVQESADPSEDCLCGMEFVGVPTQFFPPICYSDTLGVVKPDLKLEVYKEVNTMAGHSQNIESPQEPPIQFELGVMGTQYGADFMATELTELYKENGIGITKQSERFVTGQVTILEPGKQYAIANIAVKSKYRTHGVTRDINEEFMVTAILADNSIDTINYLKSLNYNA